MRRITATHVYSYVKCQRLAALDLHLSRSERREPFAWEEFAAKRGRDFEDDYVAPLGAATPAYPEREFDAGAEATLELLRGGEGLVHQAVLAAEDCLGLPDLLRKLPGASDLGAHHYEVIDVKTSGRSRGDQILQVVFYSLLLAQTQGRMPEHGALVLKDGREERFAIADYKDAAREVIDALRVLRDDMDAAQPFLQFGCSGCYHNHRCLPQLEARDDLSLVHGMSRGAQSILMALGCRTVADLATFHPDNARQRGNLDSALVRRLRKGAQARLLGRPIVEARPRGASFDNAAFVHLLSDPFADRVLAFGVLHPARADGAFHWRRAVSESEEWDALRELIALLPQRAPLLHVGLALPRWYERHAFDREADPTLERRFVEFDRRLRAAAVYPGPVFGLEGLIRLALGRDPLRAGHAGAAAIWATQPDADVRLRDKLESDLRDLAALKAAVLDVEPAKADATADHAADRAAPG